MARIKRKKTSKICAKHFKTRCCQRLGIVLNQDELKKMMQNGKLKFLFKQSNTKTHWQITIPSTRKSAVLVYDKMRKVFVTVLDDVLSHT